MGPARRRRVALHRVGAAWSRWITDGRAAVRPPASPSAPAAGASSGGAARSTAPAPAAPVAPGRREPLRDGAHRVGPARVFLRQDHVLGPDLVAHRLADPRHADHHQRARCTPAPAARPPCASTPAGRRNPRTGRAGRRPGRPAWRSRRRRARTAWIRSKSPSLSRIAGPSAGGSGAAGSRRDTDCPAGGRWRRWGSRAGRARSRPVSQLPKWPVTSSSGRPTAAPRRAAGRSSSVRWRRQLSGCSRRGRWTISTISRAEMAVDGPHQPVALAVVVLRRGRPAGGCRRRRGGGGGRCGTPARPGGRPAACRRQRSASGGRRRRCARAR